MTFLSFLLSHQLQEAATTLEKNTASFERRYSNGSHRMRIRRRRNAEGAKGVLFQEDQGICLERWSGLAQFLFGKLGPFEKLCTGFLLLVEFFSTTLQRIRLLSREFCGRDDSMPHLFSGLSHWFKELVPALVP